MLSKWLSNKKKSSVINEIVKEFERISTDNDMLELANLVKNFTELRSDKIKGDNKMYLNINETDDSDIRLEFILNNKVIGYTDNSGTIKMYEISHDYLKWKSDENRKSSSETIYFRKSSYFINGHGILSNHNRYDNQIFDFVEGTTFSNICDFNFIKNSDNKIPVIHLIK